MIVRFFRLPRRMDRARILELIKPEGFAFIYMKVTGMFIGELS
jgi:hypothetical protein